jgi:hypothetical protein
VERKESYRCRKPLLAAQEASAPPRPRSHGLSADQRQAMRDLWAAGWGTQALARIYNLTLAEARELVRTPAAVKEKETDG